MTINKPDIEEPAVRSISPTESGWAKIGLVVAVIGAALGFLMVMGAGMNNVADEGRREVFFAFPLPVVGLAVSILALVLAYRRRTLLSCLLTAVPAFVISAGSLLFFIAVLRTYR